MSVTPAVVNPTSVKATLSRVDPVSALFGAFVIPTATYFVLESVVSRKVSATVAATISVVATILIGLDARRGGQQEEAVQDPPAAAPTPPATESSESESESEPEEEEGGLSLEVLQTKVAFLQRDYRAALEADDIAPMLALRNQLRDLHELLGQGERYRETRVEIERITVALCDAMRRDLQEAAGENQQLFESGMRLMTSEPSVEELEAFREKVQEYRGLLTTLEASRKSGLASLGEHPDLTGSIRGSAMAMIRRRQEIEGLCAQLDETVRELGNRRNQRLMEERIAAHLKGLTDTGLVYEDVPDNGDCFFLSASRGMRRPITAEFWRLALAQQIRLLFREEHQERYSPELRGWVAEEIRHYAENALAFGYRPAGCPEEYYNDLVNGVEGAMSVERYCRALEGDGSQTPLWGDRIEAALVATVTRRPVILHHYFQTELFLPNHRPVIEETQVQEMVREPNVIHLYNGGRHTVALVRHTSSAASSS